MRLCLMIEGQEDVGWDDWVALARAAEQHGFEALFRSDHYSSVAHEFGRGSLDAWTTIAGLAAVTDTLRLGTLVSPATFRHPSVLAKAAATADHISGGRVEVGMGAGWMQAEHEQYGFPFAETRERMDVFAEQLEIVHHQWHEGKFSFDGEHYTLRDVDALPKPVQQPHPPLLVGGSGGRRSIALAAKWADEYNTPFPTPDRVRKMRSKVDEACEGEGRDPLRFSAMLMLMVGADESDLRDRAKRLAAWQGGGEDEARELVDNPRDGAIVGTPDQAIEQLQKYAGAGCDRVMLQHLLHTDLDALATVANEIAPALD